MMSMKQRVPFAAWLLLTVPSLAWFATAARADSFREDFDDPGLHQWVLYSNGGSIGVANGILRLSGAVRYPYLHTAGDPFPAGDFVVRLRMRYASVTNLGVGMQLPRFVPANGVPCPGSPGPLHGQPIAAIWQSMSIGLTVAHVDRPLQLWMTDSPPQGGQITIAEAPATGFHVYEFKYIDGLVEIVVDGVIVGTSTTPAARAAGVWLGNPVTGCSPGPWPVLEVDWLEVVSLETVSIVKSDWGALKQRYRRGEERR